MNSSISEYNKKRAKLRRYEKLMLTVNELLEKYDISLFALTVIKDGVNYRDNVTITPADIFAHVAAGGALCSTAAGNIADYQEMFAKYSSLLTSLQPNGSLLLFVPRWHFALFIACKAFSAS